jgi:hypothetical protein
MRRLFLLLSVGLLAFIALPSAAGAQGSDMYGVGGGSVNFGGQMKFAKFAFSGHTGPGGDFGQFRFTVETPSLVDVHVDADCVTVFPFPPGAGGYMGGPVKKVSPQPNMLGISRGDQVVLAFNDFGEPSDPVPDEIQAFPGFSQLCRILAPSHYGPIDQGNVVVKLG